MHQPPDAERRPGGNGTADQTSAVVGADVEFHCTTLSEQLDAIYAAEVDQRTELARIADSLELITSHIVERRPAWPREK